MGKNVSSSAGATEGGKPGPIVGSDFAGAIVGTVKVTVVGSVVLTTGEIVGVVVGSVTGIVAGASVGSEVGSTMVPVDGSKVILVGGVGVAVVFAAAMGAVEKSMDLDGLTVSSTQRSLLLPLFLLCRFDLLLCALLFFDLVELL